MQTTTMDGCYHCRLQLQVSLLLATVGAVGAGEGGQVAVAAPGGKAPPAVGAPGSGVRPVLTVGLRPRDVVTSWFC